MADATGGETDVNPTMCGSWHIPMAAPSPTVTASSSRARVIIAGWPSRWVVGDAGPFLRRYMADG